MSKIFVACAAIATLACGCAGDGYRDSGPPGYGGPSARYDGCSDNAAVGTILGGVAGGVIGNQFGSGSGKTAATVGGVILGGIAGNAIARDACRNESYDAYYYNRTYSDALEGPDYGRRYDWRNPHNGNYGYVTPVRRADSRRYGYASECREISQTVYVHGREYEDVSVACRMNDGSWRIVDR